MNRLVREHMPATYFAEYQALREQLIDVLADDDLAFSLGGTTQSIGVLCREIGEVEKSYVDSFRTFRQTFDDRHPGSTVERSVDALRSWYEALDRDLLAAVDAISEDDVASRKITRGDFDADFFSPLPAVQLDIYREALLIFYGKVSIYLRAMGRPLPGNWPDWIE